MKVHSNLPKLGAILLILGCLGGCLPIGSVITCPSLVKYSPEFQAAASAELKAINAPHLEQMLADYGITRDAISACVRRRDAARR